MRRPVRTARGVAGLAHDPDADIGIGADQEIRPEILGQDVPVAVERGPGLNARRCAAGRLERLFEREHETNRPPETQCHVCEQRLELRPALAAEAAPGIRRDDSHARQRQPEAGRHHTLQDERMLRRAPDRDAALIGGSGERMRLDGEMRHHRKPILPLDHQV